ncbi:lipopolysaccharide-induced tumor necrosis factor-alpha factor homolog [Engraulis encrasicolus]|uniref:lipopolysaccharide-induced tumor necrosis factor-alpha factor homolog n=1 Tax=Engraulis encrasicolus TaxID=184585 RepID=UPI002FD0F130
MNYQQGFVGQGYGFEASNQPPPYPSSPGPGAGYPPQYTPYPQPGLVQAPPTQYGMIQPQPEPGLVVVAGIPLTEVPGQAHCPHCQKLVVTETRYVDGNLNRLWALILLFVFWPCCLAPFCVDSCKDVEHRCPDCRSVIHLYKRL